jgi:outer membrane protein assembly factor BamE (lipoprotein component of BamABCDE complex)
MKASSIILALLNLLLITGCESTPKTADMKVRLGMSRFDLRYNFGEPTRIVPTSTGGEDWYYTFVAWKTSEAEDGGRTNDFGETTTYASVGVEFSKEVKEFPVHISHEGRVIKPLPPGKPVKQ